jgi:hypothetical protein
MRTSESRLAHILNWFIPTAVTLIALTGYIATLQPGLSGGDSAEAQFVPYTHSVMHYTGYPLYSVVGYLWSHIVVVGDVAYRMNLLSAVAGAVAVGLLAYVGRMISKRWLCGVLAAALLGCSTLFWDWSTKAGVRSMNVAFVVAIILLTLAWGENQTQSTSVLNGRWLALWFVVGCSLAHHRTTILVLPGIGVYLLWTRSNLLRDWRAMLSAFLALLPGLALYLYLPWSSAHDPAYQPLPVDSVSHFLDLVLARNLGDMLTSITLADVPQRLGWFIEYLLQQFGNAGVIAAATGLTVMLFRKPKVAVALWISLVLLIGFTIDYRIQGMERLNNVFLLPVHAIASLGIGYCVASILQGIVMLSGRLNQAMVRTGVRWAANIAITCASVAMVVPVAGSGLAWVAPSSEPAMNAYRYELRGSQATRLVTYAAPLVKHNAVIVGEWEHIAAFMYEKYVNGLWPDAGFRYPVDAQLGPYIDEAWNAGRAIYLTRAVPGLGNGRQLSMVGPLIQVLQKPAHELPVTAVPITQTFEDGVGLAGYEVYAQTLGAHGVLPVSLYWQAQQKIEHDYSISVRLINAQGEQVAQEDAEQPVLGSFPMTDWQVGAIIGDYYELRLPAQMPDGIYSLAIVLYERQPDGTTRNLPNLSTGQVMTIFGTVRKGK